MLPQKFKSMLGIKDDQDLKMANNIWKMLDEMSSNDPKAYQKFIQKNVTQGLTGAREQKQKKQKPYKIVPKQYILLEMEAQLQQQYIAKQENSQLKQKLDINLNKEKWSDIKLKFSNKINIFLNLCHTDRVKNPTSKLKNGQEIKQFNLSMIRDIENLYYSLQGPYFEKDNKNTWYFCMIFNTNFFRAFQAVEGGKKILLGLATAYFQERLKADRNPILMKVNTHALYGKNLYYVIQKNSIKINKQKKYKYGKDQKAGQFLLQEQVDIKQRENLKKKQQKKEKKNQITIKTVTQQKKKQILLKPNQNFQNQNSNQTSQLPPILPVKNTPQKKILIQVLDEKQSSQELSIPYQMKQTQNGYIFQFLVHGIIKIQDLDLELSNEIIKLSTINTNPQRKVQVQLSKRIDQNSIKAKMKKKIHTLQVTVNFTN